MRITWIVVVVAVGACRSPEPQGEWWCPPEQEGVFGRLCSRSVGDCREWVKPGSSCYRHRVAWCVHDSPAKSYDCHSTLAMCEAARESDREHLERERRMSADPNTMAVPDMACFGVE